MTKTLKSATAIAITTLICACGSTAGDKNQITLNPTNRSDAEQQPTPNQNQLSTATGQFLTTINHNNLDVQLVIDKPDSSSADVVMTFHGTVETDDKIVTAATKTLEETKKLVSDKKFLFVSVAYPEENLLMGDNLAHAEAALLWVKQKASAELNIKTNRIFLVGHSQGGYLVTRLNTMHATDGVIANAPGPLDLKLRCELEENGKIKESGNCARIRAAYGDTKTNPDAYTQRSLLPHLRGLKSRILFTQGMSDSQIQLRSWPILKDKIAACTGCAQTQIEELDGYHGALFANPKGRDLVKAFFK